VVADEAALRKIRGPDKGPEPVGDDDFGVKIAVFVSQEVIDVEVSMSRHQGSNPASNGHRVTGQVINHKNNANTPLETRLETIEQEIRPAYAIHGDLHAVLGTPKELA
jgi:hypothetical protein